MCSICLVFSQPLNPSGRPDSKPDARQQPLQVIRAVVEFLYTGHCDVDIASLGELVVPGRWTWDGGLWMGLVRFGTDLVWFWSVDSESDSLQ